MKQCSECGETKPLDDFHRATGAADGRWSKCKACRQKASRQWYRENREQLLEYARERRASGKARALVFGLTVDELEELLEAYGGRCAVCETPVSGKGLHIDHDHDTGRIRGVLCMHCNMAIGHFRDDPARLKRAAEYLERFSSAVKP